MKTLGFLTLSALILILSSPVFAVGVKHSGFVCKTVPEKLPGIRLSRTNAPCDPLTFSDRRVREDFRSLKVGDWVNFTGSASGVPVKVEVESLQTVGLNRLLGGWVDSRGRGFHFYSYKSMSISSATATKKYRTLEYDIFPNSFNSWRLIMVEDGLVKTGSLFYFVPHQDEAPQFQFCFDETKSAPVDCVILKGLECSQPLN